MFYEKYTEFSLRSSSHNIKEKSCLADLQDALCVL